MTRRLAPGVPRIKTMTSRSVGNADQTSKSSVIYGTVDDRNPPSGSRLYKVGVTAGTLHPFLGSLVFCPQSAQYLLQS